MAGIRSHLRRNVVAYLALFFSFTGTASALIVTGEMVKDDSLTGADIRENTLAGVGQLQVKRGNATLPASESAAVTDPITVPPGSNVLASASIRVFAVSPDASLSCALVDRDHGRVPLDSTRVTVSNAGLAFSLSGASSDALGTIGVECWGASTELTIWTDLAVTHTE